MQDSSTIKIYIEEIDRTISVPIESDLRKTIKSAFSGSWNLFNNLVDNPQFAFAYAFKADDFGIECPSLEDDLNIFTSLLLNFSRDEILDGTKDLAIKTKTFLYTGLMLGAHLNDDLVTQNFFESLIKESQQEESNFLFVKGLILNNSTSNNPKYESLLKDAKIGYAGIDAETAESSTQSIITDQNGILRALNDLSQNPVVGTAKTMEQLLEFAGQHTKEIAHNIIIKNIVAYIKRCALDRIPIIYDEIYEIINLLNSKSPVQQTTWVMFFQDLYKATVELQPDYSESLPALTVLLENSFLKTPEKWQLNKQNFCEVAASLAFKTPFLNIFKKTLSLMSNEMIEESLVSIAVIIAHTTTVMRDSRTQQVGEPLQQFFLDFVAVSKQKKNLNNVTDEQLINRYVSYFREAANLKVPPQAVARIIFMAPNNLIGRIIGEIFDTLHSDPIFRSEYATSLLLPLSEKGSTSAAQEFLIETLSTLTKDMPFEYFKKLSLIQNQTSKKNQNMQQKVTELVLNLVKKFLLSNEEPLTESISDVLNLQLLGYTGISLSQSSHRDLYLGIFSKLTDDEIRSARPSRIADYLNEALNSPELYSQNASAFTPIIRRLVELNVENVVLKSILNSTGRIVHLNLLTQFLSTVESLKNSERLENTFLICNQYLRNLRTNPSLPQLLIPNSVLQLRDFFSVYINNNSFAIAIIIASLVNQNRLDSITSPEVLKNLPMNGRDIIIGIITTKLLFSNAKNRIKLARKIFCSDLEGSSADSALQRIPIRINSLFSHTIFDSEKKSISIQLGTIVDFTTDIQTFKPLEEKIQNFPTQKDIHLIKLKLFNNLIICSNLESAKLLFEVLKKKKAFPEKLFETLHYGIINPFLRNAANKGNTFLRKILTVLNFIPEESISAKCSSSSSSSSASNAILVFEKVIVEILEEITAFHGVSRLDLLGLFLRASFDDMPLEPSVISRRILQVACGLGDRSMAFEFAKIDNPSPEELKSRIDIISDHYTELEKKLGPVSEVDSDDETKVEEELDKPKKLCTRVLGILTSNLNLFRVTEPFTETAAPLSDCLKKLYSKLQIKFESSAAIPQANTEVCLSAIDSFLNQSGALTNPKNGLKEQKPLVKKIIEIVESMQETAIARELV